ncbi:hypothetical protein [Virgisporangium aliadipatigenens]|nr:hypothetical protein [Virgisporangium aliadipatigenens]
MTRPAPSGRLRIAAGRTPGQLFLALVAVAAMVLLSGIVVAVAAGQRSTLADEVATEDGPAADRALRLYRALSDADATVAAAFLATGVEPPALRTRYDDDIATASAALRRAAADGGGGPQVEVLTAQLPVYTGLVEKARAYQRQQLPLGAAYLREASGLMRDTLLPAAFELSRERRAELGADRSAAGATQEWGLIVLVVTLGLLLFVQRRLFRRTNRVFNRGLVAATLAVLLTGGLLVGGDIAASGDLSASHARGSFPGSVLAQAQVVALQARADEALALVARGSGQEFEKDYNSRMAELVGEDGKSGLLGRAAPVLAAADRSSADGRVLADAARAARDWWEAHRRMRAAEDEGDYAQAVRLAVGTDPGTATEHFTRLDEMLGQLLENAQRRFGREAAGADVPWRFVAVGAMLLALLGAAGAAAGLQQRIGEYR